jgi:hypothetical protein
MWQTSGVVRRFFETGVLEQIGTRAGAKHIKDRDIEHRAGREHGGEQTGGYPAMLPSSGSSFSSCHNSFPGDTLLKPGISHLISCPRPRLAFS